MSFGAASSARLPLQTSIPLASTSIDTLDEAENLVHVDSIDLSPDAATALLNEYLALPVEQYALLDPNWVRRETIEGSDIASFRLSVPLKDLLNVDLRPELSISAHPDPANGRVSLVGSRAALGSPSVDGSFKLRLVAVLGSGEVRQGLPPLPGRPVQRLRRWAANRGQRRATQNQQQQQAGGEVVALKQDSDDWEDGQLSVAALSSNGGEVGEVGLENEDSTSAMEAEYGAASQHRENSVKVSDARGSVGVSAAPDGPALHCRVNVTMAVQVPSALRMVPNPLLGYAGRMVLRAVLSAALPNFLRLLSEDFQQWVRGGRQRDADAATGDLFGEGALMVDPEALADEDAPQCVMEQGEPLVEKVAG